jgi:predicted lipoprotein with Yx(FWY)xxD motif
MRTKYRGAIAVPALVLTMLLTVSLCLAGVRWNANGVAVCTAANDQEYPEIISDGSGGAIIVWHDYRLGNYDIFAQRIDSSGAPQWMAGGVALSAAANAQMFPQIAADGSGGAIITWIDYRSGSHYDIYAQRISSSGTPQWTADGVAICTAATDQQSPQITVDGSGGAVITWQDSRSGNLDIYAQRINSTGTPQWTANGVAVCTAANQQYSPQIAADGSGGAVIAWYDQRSGTFYDIYARKVNSSGTPQWTADGVALCTAANDQIYPQIAADGSGGAIITWEDYRSGAGGDIYARKVNSSGTPQWTADGVAVCTAASDQLYPQITADGLGGAILTWEDARPVISLDVYAQRVNSAGTPQWTAGGLAVCTAANNQEHPQITADGSGGAILTWEDVRAASNFDVYTQRITSSGTPKWTANGVAVCTAANDQLYPQITADGSGGAIIAWKDARSGTDYDIYSQRISNPAPSVSGITPASGIKGGTVHVTDLAGTWFSETGGAPDVRLERSGQPDIPATGVSVVSGNKITCDFDLTGAQAGAWDVVVENPDLQQSKLSSGFTVEEPPPPSTFTFYFAEGYTGPGFEEWLCLGNPGDTPVDVEVTYLFNDGSPPQTETYPVSALSRFTVSVNSIVGPDKDVSLKCEADSPFVAERPMYFNYNGVWTGGHDAVGATETSDTWYFAEGYTGPGFDEWICVLNPGDAAAELTFRFQTEEEGEKVVGGRSVPAHSRGSFKANDLLEGGYYQTSLALESTQPVVAERPMYFNYTGRGGWSWSGGHCVMGAPSLATEYFFAEGTTRGNFEEWLTMQNPGTSPISVDATYLLTSGDPVPKSYTIDAGKRLTVFVPDQVGSGKDVSIHLSSGEPFLAERPMYFDYHGMGAWSWTGGHCVIGTSGSAQEWFFAEGYTGPGFEEWLCIQNPGTSEADVTITYYPSGGAPIEKGPFTVAAHSRHTVYVNDDAGTNLQISAMVAADQPVICERPMYFDYHGWTGGHDVVGYAP